MSAPASALAARVRDAIEEAVATFEVPGAQVAWLCDGAIEQVCHGVVAQGRPGPVTDATRFRLASVTKAVTATMAVQLAGDGDLDLDEPVAPLLPDGACREVLGTVTLRQLLSHTSGLADEHPSGEGAYSSARDFLRDHASRTGLLFPPGAHFSYTNLGPIAAGHLVEAAAGRPWAEQLDAFLLEPLEAAGTCFLSRSVPTRVLAERHVRREDGELVRLAGPASLNRAWEPAAGLALSAADLLRIVRLHLAGGRAEDDLRLLEPSLVAEMRSVQADVPDASFADWWGLGWALYGDDRRRPAWFGHDGGDEGAAAFLRACPDAGFAVAMLVSCVPADAEWARVRAALASAGIDVAESRPPAMPDRAWPVDPGLAGRYENGTMRPAIALRGGELWLELGTLAALPLRGAGPDRCVVPPTEPGEPPERLLFLRDERGAVRHLCFRGRLHARAAEPGRP